ncbi:MAG: iron-containing alcohol dehydrogenase [bacterium]
MANKIWKYTHRTIVHFGAGALDLLPGVANPLAGDRKIMLVTDSSGIMNKTGVTGRITEMLGADRTVLFDKVPPNPDAAIVNEGIALHSAENCGLLIGLGGGSPLDAAKAIGVMRTHEGDISEYFLRKRTWGPKAEPVVAIPTTAGTGSEVNGNFVVTLPHDNLKCGIAAPCAWPAAALLDPTLTLSLPPYQTASTGLDALSHALEALWANNGQPLSDMNAFESIPIVLKWLPTAISDGSNLEARSKMMYASMTASLAFGSTGTAGSHALSYALTSRWNLPHGYACAFTLAEFLEFNMPTFTGGRKERLLASLNAKNEADAVAVVREFCLTHGTPAKLADIGVSESDIPMLTAVANPVNVANNAQPLSAADIEAIWRKKL